MAERIESVLPQSRFRGSGFPSFGDPLHNIYERGNLTAALSKVKIRFGYRLIQESDQINEKISSGRNIDRGLRYVLSEDSVVDESNNRIKYY